MKEIKLSDGCNYIRWGVQKVEVDETNLNFVNGIAVAEAKMTYSRDQEPYTCMGIINENFEEVFNGSGDTRGVSRNLMFLPYNMGITRFGENDFIVKVSCSDGDMRHWLEFRHIRLVNGSPIFINKIGEYAKTPFENVIATYSGLCVLNRFYDTKEGEFITPAFTKVKPLNEHGDYYVIDNVCFENENKTDKREERLAFMLNIKTRTISSVISSIECAQIGADTMTIQEYEALKEERLNKLKEQEEKYVKLVRTLTKREYSNN